MDRRKRVKIPTDYILAEKSYDLPKCAPFQFNPVGLTISTVGHNSVKKAIAEMAIKECPPAHVIVDRSGHAFQVNSLRHRSHHTENAIWNGWYPNDHHISIAFLNYGYTRKINSQIAVQSPTMFKFKCLQNIAGVWEQFTNDQILALIGFIEFCLDHGVYGVNVVGIHELQKDNHDTLGVLPFDLAFFRHALTFKDWKPMILGYSNPIQKPLRPE